MSFEKARSRSYEPRGTQRSADSRWFADVVRAVGVARLRELHLRKWRTSGKPRMLERAAAGSLSQSVLLYLSLLVEGHQIPPPETLIMDNLDWEGIQAMRRKRRELGDGAFERLLRGDASTAGPAPERA